MGQDDWKGIYREVSGLLGRRVARISRDRVEIATEKLDELKRLFVRSVVGNVLAEAHEWCAKLMEASEDVRRMLGLSEIVFPRELGSFLEIQRHI